MANKLYLTVEEVASEMGVSKSYAYKIVKRLNDELAAKNFLTVAGKSTLNISTSELATAAQPIVKGSD